MDQQNLLVDIHTHYFWIFSDEAHAFRQRMGLGAVDAGRDEAGNLVMNANGVPIILYRDVFDIAKQVAINEAAGVTRRLLTVPMLVNQFSADDQAVALRLARVFNDNLAEVVARYPHQLVGAGTICPLDRSHVSESERCIRDLGFKGVVVDTSWHGEFLDGEEAYPFWEWADATGVPIFLHPPALPIGYAQMDRYKLEEAIGRPFDTAMCLARLILSGILDRYPQLKLVAAHMGGGLSCVISRLDMGYRLGYDGMPERAKASCRQKPSDYVRRNLWVDTMGFSAEHLRAVIDLLGADRVLFGTDYGPVPISPLEHVAIVKSLGLSGADEAKILWKNADSLYGLGLAGLGMATGHEDHSPSSASAGPVRTTR
jgi:predicted TIM-barrel fold metal-dependent hydrolase